MVKIRNGCSLGNDISLEIIKLQAYISQINLQGYFN